MDDLSQDPDERDDDDRGPGNRWVVAGLAALLIATLVLGSVFLGGEDEPAVVDTASGCTVRPLKYTVTDDPEVFAEQKRFEANVNELPAAGFYEREVDLVAARHAASHSYVVVFYDDGLKADGREVLRAMDLRAVMTKAPVITAPHDEGDQAIVALARGYELACPEGGKAQADEVVRFAAQLYTSVADPSDPRATTGPAPTEPHDAPSPADPAGG